MFVGWLSRPTAPGPIMILMDWIHPPGSIRTPSTGVMLALTTLIGPQRVNGGWAHDVGH
jgi:hypothetical protein